MLTCPSCGEENPERAKFCLSCATPLAGAAPREERRVVTVLFCDLVGFTARSDRADPEDVKATLRPFHARLKREIEAFGGTLDKFIGDAALGVFGSPVAHEDDPERAVRAGLAILEAIRDLNSARPERDLAVRIGIETGEAVVTMGGAGPQVGEAVTGDVVNTASRLQGVAPVGGIVVGEAAYGATREIFLYEPRDPVSVKGKARPLRIWVPTGARARFGQDLTRAQDTPFVGRDEERRFLVRAFEEAARDRAARLVTVVGAPGVGKSRLVAELGRHVDELPDLVVWRRGRCLPYGEGVTFWALGEIVKGHAGILDSDDTRTASGKLEAVIPPSEPDREWLRQRVGPLVGIEGLGAEREELFAAWLRFLEVMIGSQPAVLVFDDIQWADPALLEFLLHVLQASDGVPLLLLCTARPELRDREVAWFEDRPNAATIRLAALSREETSQLVAVLLERAVLPGSAGPAIAERAAGNPLYAEEFVRMLRDRGSPHEGDAHEPIELPAPDSIQALIAARLDMVPADRKALLQEASVVGEVFWAGALRAMGRRDRETVDAFLVELSEKELVAAAAESSFEGEAEFAFRHALIRDVAYAQIPRAARAAMHRAAAGWIESAAGPRVEEHAEILAHHYVRAMDLAHACGDPELAADLEEPARRFLVAAGERTMGLDVGRAERHLSQALKLAPPGHPDRPHVLSRWADAARQAGRTKEAASALEEAVAAFRERGDLVAAARNLMTLSSVLLTIGDPRQQEVAEEAVSLLQDAPPGPDLAAAYGQMAGVTLVLGRHRETLAWAERAVALSAELGLETPARALGFLGYARATLGDPAGIEEMRTALTLAVERGEGRVAAVLYNNLGVAVWPVEGPGSSAAVLEDGIDFAERRGIAELASAMRAGSLDVLVDLGEWDRALATAAVLDDRASAAGDTADLIQVRWVTARVLSLRGEFRRAEWLADWLVHAGREMGLAEEIPPCLAPAAAVYAGLGRGELARELLAEIGGTPHVRETPSYPPHLPGMVRTAVAVGDVDLAAALADGVDAAHPYRRHAVLATSAALAEARGDLTNAAAQYADAAARWEEFGVAAERGFALLGRGRSLAAEGRRDEAVGPLKEARAVFTRLGAQQEIEEAERLLSGASAPLS